jgi:hypothetical protein
MELYRVGDELVRSELLSARLLVIDVLSAGEDVRNGSVFF